MISPLAEKEDNIDNDLSSDSSRGSLCKAYVKLTLLKEKLIEERRAISQDVQQLREESVKQQQASEIEEESLANRLIRKVENEERNIYNYKQKVSDEERARDIFAGVLRNAMQEQSNMENQLEADQELFLITMQRRMMEVAKKNRLLEQELYQERNRYLALISEQMHRIQEGLQTSETQRGSSEGEVEGNDSLGGEKTSQADILSLPPSTAQKPLRSPLTSPLLTSTCRSTKADPALQSATVSRGAQSLPSLTAAKEQTFSTVSLDGKDAESTTSKLLPVNHHATLVEALNERLRQLMEQNAAKEKQGKEYEQQFSELVQQFFSVQEQVAVERAKADKMKQDLKILQQRLLTHRSSRSTPSNYPSMTLYPEDSMAFSHESLSLAQTPIGTDHSLDLDNCHPQMLRMIPSNSGIYSSAGMLPPAHSDPPHFLFRSTGMASPGARLSSGMHGTIDDVVLGGTDPSTSL